MCTDDNVEVTGRWARSRAVRGGNSGGEGVCVCVCHGGAPASALRTTTTTRRDATLREKEGERERRETPVSLLLSKWDRDGGTKKGKWGGKKEGKGWERGGGGRGREAGEAGEERSRIIASHSRTSCTSCCCTGKEWGVYASRRNRCPGPDWPLARDRPSPIGG